MLAAWKYKCQNSKLCENTTPCAKIENTTPCAEMLDKELSDVNKPRNEAFCDIGMCV
jgi:hypothetical protein